jgi:UDPglucose--hexose-1-phosphate uridylyltransferase
MSSIDLADNPHRRFNPLTGDWILVSPHRNKRPWQGQTEPIAHAARPAHDSACYLCPGVARAGGARNPQYKGPYVFENDFPTILRDTPEGRFQPGPMLRAATVRGTARVICFSERHDLTLPQLPVQDIRNVVDVWVAQQDDLGRDFDWVALFENKGAAMGCSNPHPHGQVWATDFIPNEVAREDRCQARYLADHGEPLLVAYAALEGRTGDRTVVENADWIAVVPYWAVWPFEVLLLPRRHVPRLADLTDAERGTLAQILRSLCTRYDNLFRTEFPYSMGWHGAPRREGGEAHWQLHAHFYPPLLRSATVRKFMVGYEMLAEAQRDLTAEDAAARLRALPDFHYLDAASA